MHRTLSNFEKVLALEIGYKKKDIFLYNNGGLLIITNKKLTNKCNGYFKNVLNCYWENNKSIEEQYISWLSVETLKKGGMK